ncbi:MAG: NAD(P)/FAD-dependent oxidoreductase [Deltaproteobacteria bacterium]|nr:NAD(P)/FAD-dependent oxidoreductase [Deltaproteobacteria bacterium]
MSRPHVVIIGGGFGGLAAARGLAKAEVTITLIDRRNHHLFQPLLYQVATAALNASDIAYPIRAVLANQKNARVLLATAKSIDVAAKRVELDDGMLEYDYLVLATGATHSYFGNNWDQVAPGLKTVEDALEIRRRIFIAYEAAERESDGAAQREWLTFVVVGGGPTGVELAGALGEIGLHTLAHDFRSIDPTQVQVMLFEGGDRVLAAYPEKLSAAAKRSLEKRHVEVRVNSRVTAIDDRGVTFTRDGREQRLGARTVLWAAGVQASPLGKSLGVPLDRAGRVEVGAELSIPGRPEVFVVGDLAKMLNKDGSQVPGVAQGALQGGKHVAKLIAAEVEDRIDGNPVDPVALRKPFKYWDKGNMATIGRASAVVATKRVAIHGLVAWLAWWAVHILFLVGFKNRISVMFNWAWSWLSFKRGARLITGEVRSLPAVRSIGPHGEPAVHHGASTVSLGVPSVPPASPSTSPSPNEKVA